MAGKILELIIKATDKASSVFKGVGKSAQDAAKQAGGAGGGGGAGESGGGGFLERLAQTAKKNRAEKRKSGEGALASQLKSGGGLTDMALDSLNIGLPAMVIDKVGQGLASVTGKIVEMQKGLREGTEDWQSLTVKTMESIPVVGGFATAGKNIREMFTGEQAAIDGVNQETEIMNSGTERSIALSKDLKNSLHALSNERFGISLQMSVIGKEGYELAVASVGAKAKAELHAFEEDRKNQLEKLDDKHKERLHELNAQKTAENNKGTPNADVVSAIDSSLRNEKAQYESAAAKIAKASGETEAELRAKLDAERLDAERRANEQGLKVVVSYQETNLQMTSANNAEILRLNKDFVSADLQVLRDQTEARKRELDRRLAEEIKNVPPAVAAKLKAEADAQKTALDATESTSRKALEQKVADDSHLSILQKLAAAGDYEIAAEVERIQNLQQEVELRKALSAVVNDPKSTDEAYNKAYNGLVLLNTLDPKRKENELQNLQLTILQKMAAAGDVLAAAEVVRIQHLREEKELRAKINTIITDPKSSPQQVQAAKGQLGGLNAANQQSIAADLLNQYKDATDAEAQYGATAGDRLKATKDAERLKIEEEAKQRAAAVKAVMNDPAATADQKKWAQDNFAKWTSLQGRRFDAETQGKADAKPLATLQETHHLTGLAQQAQEKADKAGDQLKATEAGNKIMSDLLIEFKKITAGGGGIAVGLP